MDKLNNTTPHREAGPLGPSPGPSAAAGKLLLELRELHENSDQAFEPFFKLRDVDAAALLDKVIAAAVAEATMELREALDRLTKCVIDHERLDNLHLSETHNYNKEFVSLIHALNHAKNVLARTTAANAKR